MTIKKFNIEVEMEERWVDYFMSFLNHMESLGEIGSSQKVAFYSDGYGDFRPKFKANIDYNTKESDIQYWVESIHVYDAG